MGYDFDSFCYLDGKQFIEFCYFLFQELRILKDEFQDFFIAFIDIKLHVFMHIIS